MKNPKLNNDQLYEQGLFSLYEMEDTDAALDSLFGAAAAGYEPAYGEIGVIFSSERNDQEKAESWFEKVENIESFSPVAAYEYGALLYNAKNDWEAALIYLFKAAQMEYVPAYQAIAVILYQELGEIDEAEAWFEKAKEEGCLCVIPAYYYGILREFERGIDGEAEYYRARAIEDLCGPKSKQDLNYLNALPGVSHRGLPPEFKGG
jgi:tetratricopeptide (TPR) repeat protein